MVERAAYGGFEDGLSDMENPSFPASVTTGPSQPASPPRPPRPFGDDPPDRRLPSRLDAAVQAVSRWSGPVLLLLCSGGLGWLIPD